MGENKDNYYKLHQNKAHTKKIYMTATNIKGKWDEAHLKECTEYDDTVLGIILVGHMGERIIH